jgi:hypothetical protein
MLVAGDSVNEVMITLVCDNVNGKWKVRNILGEDFSLNKRDAIEQFHYAKTLEKHDDLMDAVNTMGLANHCNAPGGGFFRYKNAAGMKKYNDSLTNIAKAKYAFPYLVNELDSKPSVFNIHYEVFKAQFAPMIMYQSSISVSDTVSLKKENDELQKNIGAVFTGMDINNNIILYRAYNELPDGKNNPAYYGYVQKLR